MNVLSLFAGAGFLDLGFYYAGFNICFVNEINEKYLSAYKHSRKMLHIEPPHYGFFCDDVRRMLDDNVWSEIFENDFDDQWGIIGGPPCPDFSVAGKNEGSDGKYGILTSVYFDLILKRKPSFFVFENVKGLYITQKHRAFYEKQKERLQEGGYWLTDSILNSLSFGAPQYRDRLFLVGINKEQYGDRPDYVFPSSPYDLNNILHRSWPSKCRFVEDSIIKEPDGIPIELTIEYWFRKNKVLSHYNQNDCFRTKKNNTKFTSIMEGDTSGKSFKRLHRWKYSPTAAYGNNEVHLHPYKPRRLSVAEALAIQSLPKEFELPDGLSLSEKFKMVGNGVPYLMAKYIAKSINDWMEKNKVGL